MTTSFLSKKVLNKQIKDAEDLDKLYKQMRANSEANKLMETSFDDALARQYKPLIKVINKQTEAIGEQKSEKTKGLLAIEGPRAPAISSEDVLVGDLIDFKTEDEKARDFIIRLLADKDNEKAAYYIKSEGSTFSINNLPVTISEGGKAITVNDITYDLTPGLVHLLTSSNESGNIKRDDVETYLHVMNDAGITVASKSKKFKLLKSHGVTKKNNEWYVYGKKVISKTNVSGSGLLPSNPLSLYKMLNLRLAAYKAGNTGLRNEVIAISDELLRQKAIKKEDYKKIVGIVENVKSKKK